jgi:hypothetical protein
MSLNIIFGTTRRIGAMRKISRVGSTTLAVWLVIIADGLPADTGVAAKKAGSGGLAPPIRDNSFLIEEAYNQEDGVVQHISTYTRDRMSGSWVYSFTQEWPMGGELHQLSYTALLQGPGSDGSGGTGVGDAAINYRIQAIAGDRRLAFAPRVSLLLPSGDERDGRGAGSTGIQANLPLSLAISRHFVTHTNLGFTLLPAARNSGGDRARADSLSAGQSVIWQIRPAFNLMLEALWSRTEEVIGPGATGHINEAFVSPGFRVAINRPSGLQIVPGLAVPIGVGPTRGKSSFLVYLSFEHPLRRSATLR